MESWLRVDLASCGRLAWRSVLRARWLTATAVGSLTAGIALTAAVLGVVDTLFVRPLPYPNAHELFAASEGGPSSARRGWTLPLGLVERWHAGDATGAAFAAYWPGGPATVAGGAVAPRTVHAIDVSPGFWSFLGVTIERGREFVGSDFGGDGGPVALVSARLGTQLAVPGGDVVGQTIRVAGRPVTVVGVVPADAPFPSESAAVPDVFLPLPPGRPDMAGSGPRGRVLIRSQAPAAAAARLTALASDAATGGAPASAIHLEPLQSALAAHPRPIVLTMTLAVLCVLALSCVNVVHLFAAQGRARAPQFATQLCLGARRVHLAVQVLFEAGLVAAISGALGLALALLILHAVTTPLQQALQLYRAPQIDWRFGVLTAGLAIGVALLVGGCSAARLARAPLHRGNGSPDASDRAFYVVVLAGQTAISFVLLFGAGLLLNSFGRLLATDLGLDPNHVTTISVRLPRETAPAAASAAYARLEEQIGRLPGVERTAMADPAPFDGSVATNRIEISGRAGLVEADVRRITPSYFELLAVPLVAGRVLAARDMTAAPTAAIVNESLVRRWWPGADPIGQRLRVGERTFDVVGVVADARESAVHSPVVPAVYLPFSDPSYRRFAARDVLVRRRADSPAVGAMLDRLAGGVLPVEAEWHTREMATALDLQVIAPRTYSALLGTLAATAMGLMIVGMLGIATAATERRLRRATIAVALGASPRREIGRLVLATHVPVAIGLVVGGIAAHWAGALVASQIVGISTTDATTMIVAAALLVVSSLGCAYLPARRFRTLQLTDLLKDA